MSTMIKRFVTVLMFVALARGEDLPPLTGAPGPFKGDMVSLKQYECPAWFRDAKFGIWAHWGPQAVPMAGDWYAKHTYVQGHRQYQDHLERYGHPSTNGYKDIIPQWKAEKWDPDRLMQLYKKAGARYFVSMGTHHDNFFLWNSKLHRWNAVNMGPHRDVVGDWQKAAQKYGLKFGVSEHLGASFTWFQPSHGADKDGPFKGVPYDGANPEFQDLYHFPAEPGDTGWYSKNPKWQRQWYAEIKELVDNYHPDLLYTDGGVPFGNEVGMGLVAHFYNANAAAHDGRCEAIYNCKQVSEGRWVQDLERGIMAGIDPHPWQTDTSIGDWFYNKNWKFRPVTWVIHMLVDNVSKNGNLLLNVVQRPDGSLDPEVEQMLGELADWTAIHGEAIYGSRPWLVYGEGAVKTKGGNFKEDFTYSSKDIRFTQNGGILYALALGWPEGNELTIRSLARPDGESVNNIRAISLLGSAAKIAWKQTADGLVVTLPAEKPNPYTIGLKIEGSAWKNAPVITVVEPIRPDARGNLKLTAEDAELHGDQLKVESQGVHSNIGFWDKADEWASWKISVPAAGRYNVSLNAAAQSASAFRIVVGAQTLEGKVDGTGAWDVFKNFKIGPAEIQQAGVVEVSLRPRDAQSWRAINLRDVRLDRKP